MAPRPKDDKGIYISEKEMNDLGEFLTSLQQYVLNHEARLAGIEEWLAEFMKAQVDPSEEYAGNTAPRPRKQEVDPEWENEGGSHESANNSQSRQDGEKGVRT